MALVEDANQRALYAQRTMPQSVMHSYASVVNDNPKERLFRIMVLVSRLMLRFISKKILEESILSYC